MKKLFYKIIGPFRTAYWFIFRPKTAGVKCLIEYDGKFLMIRNTYGIKHWTFPGGGVHRREKFADAARREARKEVGIDLPDLIPIGEYVSTRQYKRDTVYCFYARVSDDHFQIDNDEVAVAQWFAVADMPTPQSRAVRSVLDLYTINFAKNAPAAIPSPIL